MEARDIAIHPKSHPTTRNYLTQNASSSKVEKQCSPLSGILTVPGTIAECPYAKLNSSFITISEVGLALSSHFTDEDSRGLQNLSHLSKVT